MNDYKFVCLCCGTTTNVKDVTLDQIRQIWGFRHSLAELFQMVMYTSPAWLDLRVRLFDFQPDSHFCNFVIDHEAHDVVVFDLSTNQQFQFDH